VPVPASFNALIPATIWLPSLVVYPSWVTEDLPKLDTIASIVSLIDLNEVLF